MSSIDNDDMTLLVGPSANSGWPDLYQILKRNTGTGSTEVHILSAASGYRDYLLHTGTGLHETNRNFTFRLADWDRDGIPDLWAIMRSGTGTGKVEVHVWSGSSNFANRILAVPTALDPVGPEVEFDVIPLGRSSKPSLAAIVRSGTGTNSTEVHILTGDSNFQSFALRTGTGMHETGVGDDWMFRLMDWNKNGVLDLVAFRTFADQADHGEIHVLDGLTGLQQFGVHTVVNQNNFKNVFNVDDVVWSTFTSCGTAALALLGVGALSSMSAGAAMLALGGTYLLALDCHRNIYKFRNLPDSRPSGGGGPQPNGPDRGPDARPQPRPPREPDRGLEIELRPAN